MNYEEIIGAMIAEINRRQAEALLKSLTVSFVKGYRTSGSKVPISDLQRYAIANLTQQQIGYLSEFNSAIGKQLLDTVRAKMAEGGGYEAVRDVMQKSIKEVFGGTIQIDRTGQLRRIVQVNRDGSLEWFDKLIKQPYSSSIEAYSDMLSRTAVHSAVEHGRSQGYKSKGIEKMRYLSVLDSRTRPHHMAMNGKILDIGSLDEAMAQSVLSEPHCRCRLIPFFDDTDIDTPQKEFEKEKKEAGLIWKDDMWQFKGDS